MTAGKDEQYGEAFKTEHDEAVRGAFHSYGGWYWKRRDDGSVEVFVLTPDGERMIDHVVDADSWASIVASVSLGGETGATHAAALDFHGGKVARPGEPRSEPSEPRTALESYQQTPTRAMQDLEPKLPRQGDAIGAPAVSKPRIPGR